MFFCLKAKSQSIAESDSAGMNKYWRKYIVGMQKKIGLQDGNNVKEKDYFRIWVGGVVVEVWRGDSITIGQLTHWVEEYVPYGEEETGRYFVIKEDLDSVASVEIYSIISKCNLRQMPSSQFVANWKNGLDGIEYIVEDKLEGSYKLKNYWTPSAQKGVYEADVLENFTKELFVIINETERRKYFEMSIPFQSWMSGTITITSRIMTYSQAARMKLERKRYRRLKQQQRLHDR